MVTPNDHWVSKEKQTVSEYRPRGTWNRRGREERGRLERREVLLFSLLLLIMYLILLIACFGNAKLCFHFNKALLSLFREREERVKRVKGKRQSEPKGKFLESHTNTAALQSHIERAHTLC